jgi:hypothetical protein
VWALRGQEDKMVYERSPPWPMETLRQMELYLKYLKKYEMQHGEEEPIGLLLCSEGNTEHMNS